MKYDRTCTLYKYAVTVFYLVIEIQNRQCEPSHSTGEKEKTLQPYPDIILHYLNDIVYALLINMMRLEIKCPMAGIS